MLMVRKSRQILQMFRVIPTDHEIAFRSFNPAKIAPCSGVPAVPITRGQLLYERDHLLGKLTVRDSAACRVLAEAVEPAPHPLFTIREGAVENWERLPKTTDPAVEAARKHPRYPARR